MCKYALTALARGEDDEGESREKSPPSSKYTYDSAAVRASNNLTRARLLCFAYYLHTISAFLPGALAERSRAERETRSRRK